MSTGVYHACHQAVSAIHQNPDNSFLDVIVDTIDAMSDTVFDVNPFYDIYSVMLGSLGPYTSIHRKAVMCEVLRVEAGFESDWNWNQGVDTKNSNSVLHKEGQETGAFQVSWDSLAGDPTRACRRAWIGISKYCARLLRFNTRWCGTINDPQQLIAHVRRDAVAEFQSFLTPNEKADAMVSAPKAAARALGKTKTRAVPTLRQRQGRQDSDKVFPPRHLTSKLLG